MVLGAARDGQLARALAGAGARIMAAVGATTTRLVISGDQPFGCFVTAHAQYRQAEALRGEGVSITITTEAEMDGQLGTRDRGSIGSPDR